MKNTKKEKGCTCENYSPTEPHEYTCKLNLCQVEKTFKNTKHTPTPWKREGFSVVSHGERESHHWFLAECRPDNGKGTVKVDNEKEAIANAEFIVRAVNSHEALLQTAKELLKAIKGEGMARNWGMWEQAIAQAEGK